MIIYFINQKSSLTGPFDITDSFNNKILKIGDFCVKETSDGVSLLLVNSTNNKWSSCTCLGKVNDLSGIESNMILFSHDCLKKRYGHIKELEVLSYLFSKTNLHVFFENAIDILSNKCNCWDLNVFLGIGVIGNVTISTKPTEYVSQKKDKTFVSYLNGKTKDLFMELYSEKIDLKDIFKQIRERYPKEFRASFLKFIEENPTSTIYDNVNKKN